MKKNSFKKATQDAAHLPVINTGNHCTIDSKNYELFSQFEWFQDDDGRIKTLVYVLSPQIMDLAEMVYAQHLMMLNRRLKKIWPLCSTKWIGPT
jgi:hypothetical protein